MVVYHLLAISLAIYLGKPQKLISMKWNCEARSIAFNHPHTRYTGKTVPFDVTGSLIILTIDCIKRNLPTTQQR